MEGKSVSVLGGTVKNRDLFLHLISSLLTCFNNKAYFIAELHHDMCVYLSHFQRSYTCIIFKLNLSSYVSSLVDFH